MQILYQMDMTANSNAERLEDLLDDTHDGPAVRKEAMGLAAAVWCDHEAADVAEPVWRPSGLRIASHRWTGRF